MLGDWKSYSGCLNDCLKNGINIYEVYDLISMQLIIEQRSAAFTLSLRKIISI